MKNKTNTISKDYIQGFEASVEIIKVMKENSEDEYNKILKELSDLAKQLVNPRSDLTGKEFSEQTNKKLEKGNRLLDLISAAQVIINRLNCEIENMKKQENNDN